MDADTPHARAPRVDALPPGRVRRDRRAPPAGHPTNVDATDTLRLAQAWLDEVDAENAD